MGTIVWCMNFDATKLLGRAFKNTTAEGISGKTSFVMLESEQKDFLKIITGLYLKNHESFNKYLSLYEGNKKKFTDACRSVASVDLKKQNNLSLSKIYKDFEDVHNEFMLIGQYIAYNLVETIPSILKQKLSEEKIKLDDINRILPVVLYPTKEKAVSKMEEEIVKLGFDLKKGRLSENKKEAAIKLLVKKYSWIPAMIPEIHLWNEKFFQDRINEAAKESNLEKTLQKISDSKKENEKIRNSFVTVTKQYPKLKDLFLMAQQLTDLKNERDEARRFAYFLMRPLFHEIALRAELKIDELMTFSPKEIYNFLQKRTLLTKEEIGQRKENFIVHAVDGKLEVYSGKKAADFSKEYLASEEGGNKESFTGIVAFLGIVQGTVRIVSDKKDLLKVKQGEILVAITTHPDYLSAMKRAKAIITDEGGLTSHAAIVSREFKIPCIVGTKIATKVLKDGDLVELDANKGVVKKIK